MPPKGWVEINELYCKSCETCVTDCPTQTLAIDRSRLTQEHLDYVIAAVKALYEDRESIPNMRIVWGHNLPMRHFHAFLEPYPNEEK